MRADGDMTKLIVAFCYFANTPKNVYDSHVTTKDIGQAKTNFGSP